MIVENAKQHIATAVKTETQLPYVEVNPRIVSSAPAAAPYETGIPLQRITSAVRVQMTMVSVNTSKIPKNPCLTGLRVSAQACAIEPEDEYDLAGFAVGVIDKKDLLTGEELKPGDVLIGMASTGVHSNGFSLVRKVFEMTKESLDTYYDELGTTLGEALIAPTRIYVKALKSVKEAGVRIHACSHITGGGFYENVPRMLKDGTRAVIEKNSYPVLPIFDLLAKTGDIEEKMMYNTFNMGLGMVLAVDPSDVDKTMEAIRQAGDTPYVVGRIEAGEKGVTLC